MIENNNRSESSFLLVSAIRGANFCPKSTPPTHPTAHKKAPKQSLAPGLHLTQKYLVKS